MFVDGLMTFPIAGRPTAQQALQHGFLTAASLANAEKDMQLCLPGFNAKKDLLPVLPSCRSCHLPAAAAGSSWGIGALHGTAPMHLEPTNHVADLGAVQHASRAGLVPDRDAADTSVYRYGRKACTHAHLTRQQVATKLFL